MVTKVVVSFLYIVVWKVQLSTSS